MSPVPAVQTHPSIDIGALFLEQVSAAPLGKPLKGSSPTSKSGVTKEAPPSQDSSRPKSDKELPAKKVWIRYTIKELLALSKSPLCQPPNPMPILDGKKYLFQADNELNI